MDATAHTSMPLPRDPNAIASFFKRFRSWRRLVRYDTTFDADSRRPYLPSFDGQRALPSFGNRAFGEGLQVRINRNVIRILGGPTCSFRSRPHSVVLQSTGVVSWSSA